MEADLRHHLISCAEAFGAARKLESSTVARLATGDWRFFERIDSGASFTARKYDAIMGWFSLNWPADTVWPVGVPRAQARSEAAMAIEKLTGAKVGPLADLSDRDVKVISRVLGGEKAA